MKVLQNPPASTMQQEYSTTTSYISSDNEEDSNNNAENSMIMNPEVANADWDASVLHDRGPNDQTFAPPNVGGDLDHPLRLNDSFYNQTFAPQAYSSFHQGDARTNRNVTFDGSANKSFAPTKNTVRPPRYEGTQCDPNATFCPAAPQSYVLDDPEGKILADILKRHPAVANNIEVWNDPTTGQSMSSEKNYMPTHERRFSTVYDTPKASKKRKRSSGSVEHNSVIRSEPRDSLYALAQMIANPKLAESVKYGILVSVDELLLSNAATPLPLIQETICMELVHLMSNNSLESSDHQDMVKRILSIVGKISAYSPEGKLLVQNWFSGPLQKMSSIANQATELLAQLK
jgi:hypothetical protein